MQHQTLADALAYGRGNERAFRCPVHDDSHASASVNVTKGVWFCYACGAKGKTDGYIEIDDQRFAEDIEELLDAAEPRTYTESYLDQFTTGGHYHYWTDRFRLETIAHFRLGYDFDTNQPVYPMRDTDGTVLGVVRRNPDGVMPKYRYPRGVQKSRLLHNYTPDQRDVVILTEGAPDVWAAWEAGHEAFGLYGAVLHPHQLLLIQRVDPKRVVLALDNDEAGIKATNHIAGVLLNYGYDVWGVDWPKGIKDLAQADEKTRKTLLDPLAL